MRDLNSLVPANSPLYLLEGLDINSRGQIVGFAFQRSTGEVHAYLANPCDQRCNDTENCEDQAEGATDPVDKQHL